MSVETFDMSAWVDNRNFEEPVLMLVAVVTATYLQLVRAEWVDEQITYRIIETYTPVEILFNVPQNQPHLPTWYMVADILGVPLTISLSVLAFAGTAVGTYRLAQLYAPATNAYVAGFLVAVSPFLAVQAGWLRMYGLLVCLLTWGLYFGIERRYGKALSLFVIAGLIHPFAVFGSVWIGGVLLVRRDLHGKHLPALAAAVLPTAVLVLYDTSSEGLTASSTNMVHGLEPTVQQLLLTPLASLLGGFAPSIIGYGYVMVTALVASLVDYRRQWPLVAWVLTPIVGMTIASYVLHPLFRIKYFGFIAPAMAVLIATNLTTTWRRVVIGGGVGLGIWVGWLYAANGAIVTRYFRLCCFTLESLF